MNSMYYFQVNLRIPTGESDKKGNDKYSKHVILVEEETVERASKVAILTMMEDGTHYGIEVTACRQTKIETVVGTAEIPAKIVTNKPQNLLSDIDKNQLDVN